MHALYPSKMDLRQRWVAFFILAGFFFLFASISLVNHWMFRTFGWDLAYFNSALFDYSQFRLNHYDLWHMDLVYTMGDHFEPIMFIIGPLRYIFGEYTLLLVQMGAILFGSYGTFVMVRHKSDHPWLPHLAMVHYLTLFGIYSALSFDYHNNVVGAMFLPWLVHYFDRGRFRAAAVFLLLLCMSKENMALWAVFIMAGTGLHFWRDRQKRNWALGMTLFSGLYFVFAMKVVLPAFQPEGVEYKHFRYSILGETAGEALKTVFTRPWFVLKTMFTNHFPEKPHLDGLKSELYTMILLAGGWAILLKPRYLIMALPIIGQKVFSDKPGTWGITHHYSIELVPIISLALLASLEKLSKPKIQALALAGLGALSFFATVSHLANPKTPFAKYENVNFLSQHHWIQPAFDLQDARTAIDMIPDGVPVSATNTMLPHLAMRDQAYMFPKVENAEYILILREVYCYPAKPEEIEEKVAEFKAGNEWEVLFERGKIILFKRI